MSGKMKGKTGFCPPCGRPITEDQSVVFDFDADSYLHIQCAEGVRMNDEISQLSLQIAAQVMEAWVHGDISRCCLCGGDDDEPHQDDCPVLTALAILERLDPTESVAERLGLVV
jgi:hypothetical protein